MSIKLSITLDEFVFWFQKQLNLPPFSTDFENVYEWGEVRNGAIGYNISRDHQDDPGGRSDSGEWTVIVQMFDTGHFSSDLEWLTKKHVPEILLILENKFGVLAKFEKIWYKGQALPTQNVRKKIKVKEPGGDNVFSNHLSDFPFNGSLFCACLLLFSLITLLCLLIQTNDGHNIFGSLGSTLLLIVALSVVVERAFVIISAGFKK